MNEESYTKIITSVILIVLLVLAFFILKPILLASILGIILAFIFMPVYDWLKEKIRYKNLSAFILCLLLIIIIILPFWFLTPIFINQSVKIYLASQQADFITPFKTIFPNLFASEEFSSEFGAILQSFVTGIANSVVKAFSRLILDSPVLLLQSLVVFFTFFFVLRDKQEFLSYLKSLLPFSEEVQKKLFKQTKEITFSVLYGQIIIGLLQGILVGVGFFLFGVPNALLMTLLAAIAGVFPVIGTTIVWLPIAGYLLISGNTFSAIGVGVFGVLSSVVDNLLKPVIVSRRTQMHSSLVLFGMIGGLFLFGMIGFILGPLVLAYLLILVEVYRNKRTPGIFVREK